MSFNLVDVFRHMQPFAIAIVAVLGLMAMIALSIFVERMWTYFRSRRQAKAFGAAASPALERRELGPGAAVRALR
jgi:hypothetical protein